MFKCCNLYFYSRRAHFQALPVSLGTYSVLTSPSVPLGLDTVMLPSASPTSTVGWYLLQRARLITVLSGSSELSSKDQTRFLGGLLQ